MDSIQNTEVADRELLELAAKAAGMPLLVVPWPDVDGWFFCVQHGHPALHFRKYGTHAAQNNTPSWKPLTEDGDALRLAVKLRLDVDHNQTDACVYGHGVAVEMDKGQDPYAATRRAIVRAAAEIGRSL